MIGFLLQPTGRLGNILLQYLFLRQIASRVHKDYFHPVLKGSEYFENLEETENYKKEKQKIFGKKKIKNKQIQKQGISPFIQGVEKSNKTMVLIPPVLGYTFDTLYEDPNCFLRIKKDFQNPYFEYEGYFVVAMHFRGTDFATWNPNACLDAEYYLAAIDYCIRKYGDQNIKFSLFTDDVTIESYKKTIDYLKEKNYDFHEGDPQRNLGEECYNISISDLVVSSPSTFAITASLLGKKKTIIHSKKWCEYSVARNDVVWIRMLENRCQYYQIECIL